MGKAKPVLKVPFYGPEHHSFEQCKGLMHYPNEFSAYIDWRDNQVFLDCLMIQDFARGRSAAYLMWKSMTSGNNYPMFLVDLLEVIKNGIQVPGAATTYWTFQKRGMNYGIRRAKPDEIDQFVDNQKGS